MSPYEDAINLHVCRGDHLTPFKFKCGRGALPGLLLFEQNEASYIAGIILMEFLALYRIAIAEAGGLEVKVSTRNTAYRTSLRLTSSQLDYWTELFLSHSVLHSRSR